MKALKIVCKFQLILLSLYSVWKDFSFTNLIGFSPAFEMTSSFRMLANNGQKISAKQVTLTSWIPAQIDIERFRWKTDTFQQLFSEAFIEGSEHRFAWRNWIGQKKGGKEPLKLFWPNFHSVFGLFWMQVPCRHKNGLHLKFHKWYWKFDSKSLNCH